MKKMFFIAMLLLSVTFAEAQLNFGIKAGYNSSLSFDNISSVQSGDYNLSNIKSELANGFHAGAFARIFFDKVYVQPELLYSMQKKEYEMTVQNDENQDVSVDKFVNFSTIDIPFLIGYKVLDLKIANLRVFTGPKLRLNAGSEISFANLTDGDGINKEKLMGELKNSQIGLEAGAGIDVLMLTFDFRFNLINDIYQATWETRPTTNTNFVISLGWKIF
ncbi:MAG: PorT family protein [Bacteroidales bacterium]|nr:PorT family protein [Bacteroidales bacterium]